MEPIIAFDTACGGFSCYLCQEEILANEHLMIWGTGEYCWVAHWHCFEATE